MIIKRSESTSSLVSERAQIAPRRHGVPEPQEGANYYIGAEAPYDLCTYVNGEWINNGPISVDTTPYYDLDLTETVTVKSTDNALTAGSDYFDLSEVVDAEALLAALEVGQTVRIFFKDGFFSKRTVSTLLTDVYIGGNTDNVLAYLGSTYLSVYTGRYAKLLMVIAYSDGTYQVGLNYARDPGGSGGGGMNNVHILDIGDAELDVTQLDLSGYSTGDVLLIIQNVDQSDVQ